MNVKELKVEMVRHNDTVGSLAAAIGKSRSTLSKKINSERGDFTQSEISAISDHYQLTSDRVAEIFFADLVSE